MVLKTPIELARDVITKKKKPVKFTDILKYIKERLDYSDEQIIQETPDILNDLISDPLFVYVGNQTWTLKDRVKYDDIKKTDVSEDEKEIESEDDEDEEVAPSDDSSDYEKEPVEAPSDEDEDEDGEDQ